MGKDAAAMGRPCGSTSSTEKEATAMDVPDWLRRLQMELGGSFTWACDKLEDVFVINGVRYAIQSLLGEGSYGSVYKCQVENSEQPGTAAHTYAVKVISADRVAMFSRATKEAAVERMLLEAEILGCVAGHPHIVKLYQAAVSPNSLRIFIIMQLVQSAGLFTDILQKRRALDEQDARTVASQLSMAVAHCHRRNVTHRNIKLENVMLDSQRPLSVKLVGFGRAKMMSKTAQVDDKRINSTAKTLTTTELYMPPDVRKAIQENSAYDAFKLDSFAIGVVLYALMCHQFPDTAGNQNYLKNKRWCQLSKEAQDLIHKLLCRDSTQRLSAHEILSHPWLLGTRIPSQIPKTPTPGVDRDNELQSLLRMQQLNQALQKERGASCWMLMLDGIPESESNCRWLYQDTDERIQRAYDALSLISLDHVMKLQTISGDIACHRRKVQQIVVEKSGKENFNTVYACYNSLNEEVINIIGELLVAVDIEVITCCSARVRMLLIIAEQLGRERAFITGHLAWPDHLNSLAVQVRFARIQGCRELLLGTSQSVMSKEVISNQQGLMCNLRLTPEPLLSKEDLQVLEAAESSVFQAADATASESLSLITGMIDKIHQQASMAIVKFVQELPTVRSNPSPPAATVNGINLDDKVPWHSISTGGTAKSVGAAAAPQKHAAATVKGIDFDDKVPWHSIMDGASKSATAPLQQHAAATAKGIDFDDQVPSHSRMNAASIGAAATVKGIEFDDKVPSHSMMTGASMGAPAPLQKQAAASVEGIDFDDEVPSHTLINSASMGATAPLQTNMPSLLSSELQSASASLAASHLLGQQLSPKWTPLQYTPEATPIHADFIHFQSWPKNTNPFRPGYFAQADYVPPDPPVPAEAEERIVVTMSKGTMGHPHFCRQLGCKFATKKRGCKDGVDCPRCHLCPWSRSSETQIRLQ